MNQSRLAEVLGVSRQLIAHHVKSGKAPAVEDVDGWFEFLAATGRHGSLPSDARKEIGQARLRLIKAQADRVEIENMARRKEMMPFNKVEIFFQKFCVVGFWAELNRLKEEFPPNLKGKSEIEIYEECDKQIEQIKANLQNRLSIWMNENGKEDETQKAA